MSRHARRITKVRRSRSALPLGLAVLLVGVGVASFVACQSSPPPAPGQTRARVDETASAAPSTAEAAVAAPVPVPARAANAAIEAPPVVKTPDVDRAAPATAPPVDDSLAKLWRFDPVPYVPPGDVWKRFVVLVWQHKTDVRKDLPLYREVGINGFHIDYGSGSQAAVAFANEHDLPYYNDHAAAKGYLHLMDRTGKKEILRKNHLVPRPKSLVDPKTIAEMKDWLKRNISVTRGGPVVAYAYDDEVSLGSFNSPAEVDSSPRSVAGYRNWLAYQYGSVGALNEAHGTAIRSFDEAQPLSFEDLRRDHVSAPFARWRLARWTDWRSYMDSQFAACLAGLTRYANTLDPKTPGGIVGGMQPAPYGGYDYEKLTDAMQFIESYDIGGTCEILRSLWAAGPQRKPYVQTWFSTGEARRDSWFLWYYLLHGSRGVIAWPDKGGSWFHHKDGGIAPFVKDNAANIREVQTDVSRAFLDLDARCDPDPIAVYYSHRSVQANWVMDVATHGGSWPNRMSSLDNTCQTAGKNRVVWFKLLEDCGYQYNVVTPRQVTAGDLVEKGYKVLVMGRISCLSDAEAAAIRRFVEAGGTVIADHLTGVFDERGNGRPAGGALDGLFGIARDESQGYLDGTHITEIDGELYQKPFLERLHFYEGALRHEGIVVYERGTTARGGTASARVGSADVVVRNTVGKGRTVYLNLTPIEYIDMNARLGAFGRTWQTLVGSACAEAGLAPRARVFSGGEPVPVAEFVFWRRGDRQVVGLIMNPTREAGISGAGEIVGVTGAPMRVKIVFAKRHDRIVDLRTGKRLPGGATIHATWNPSQALVYEVDAD